MFKAFKEQVALFFSRFTHAQLPENKQPRNNRKRRYSSDDEDDHDFPMNKRQRNSFTGRQNTSTLFGNFCNYLFRNQTTELHAEGQISTSTSRKNPCKSRKSNVSTKMSSQSTNYSEDQESTTSTNRQFYENKERSSSATSKVLTPRSTHTYQRKGQSHISDAVIDLTNTGVRQRKTLPQISNATIFDLTNIDDSDSENVTKNLESESSNDLCSTTSVFKKKGNSSTPRTNESFSKMPSHGQSICYTESFGQDEKEQYKDILAQYTNVTLPKYSESISRNSSSIVITEDENVSSLCPRFMMPENINTSPLFQTPKYQKKITIDLTQSKYSLASSLDYTRKQSPAKSNIIEIDLDGNKSSSIDFNIENTTQLSKTTTSSLSSNKSSLDTNIIFGPDWIKRWKETLDPIQLERDRRINYEERKKEAIKKRRQEEIETLSKKNEQKFPALSDEMLSKVKRALGPGNSGDVLAEGFNAQITREDISTLRESKWLNDEVVNFYFNLVKYRSEQDNNLPKIHVFNTFFYPKIMKTGHSGVKRWTRKVDIFAKDVILVPVHLGMHWCLASVDFKNKEIAYYDSLKGKNQKCIEALRKYLNDESMDKKKKNFDFTGWKDTMPSDIPEQMNFCDCGVFMCKYAEYKSRYADFTFSQDNMPYFRKRMVYEILTKKLL